ncbi:MAG: ATP-binding protein [Anaerolineales bacterium]|nr:ATP-binding protein [Anaerolineales bacterium]
MPGAVYVLIGVQGSGKSTWARANAERLGATVVSSDEIRNELEAAGIPAEGEGDRVFAILEARVAQIVAHGGSAIADATHVFRAWRSNLVTQSRRQGARLVAVWFNLPLGVCLARNAARPGGDWGCRPAPATVVADLWRRLEPPRADEFDEIVKISA